MSCIDLPIQQKKGISQQPIREVYTCIASPIPEGKSDIMMSVSVVTELVVARYNWHEHTYTSDIWAKSGSSSLSSSSRLLHSSCYARSHRTSARTPPCSLTSRAPPLERTLLLTCSTKSCYSFSLTRCTPNASPCIVFAFTSRARYWKQALLTARFRRYAALAFRRSAQDLRAHQ